MGDYGRATINRSHLPYFCSRCGSLTPVRAQYPGAKPPPDDLKTGFDAVKIDDAKRVVTYLATQCEGRGTGQPG